MVAFLTEWGFLTYLPIGLTSSGDIFCHRTDEALAGIPGVHKLVNDVLVVRNTKKQLMERVRRIFENVISMALCSRPRKGLNSRTGAKAEPSNLKLKSH